MNYLPQAIFNQSFAITKVSLSLFSYHFAIYLVYAVAYYCIITVYKEEHLPPVRNRYFDAVLGLVWPDEPESYAGGSIATGRVFNVGQDKDEKLDPGPLSWGLGVGIRTPPHKNVCCEASKKRPTEVCNARRRRRRRGGG